MFKRAAAPATGRAPVVLRTPLCGSGEERTARRVEGVARERHTVGYDDLLVCGKGWTTRCVAVGTRERMPVGHKRDVLGGGVGRASRGAAVGARERLPVGRESDVYRRWIWPRDGAAGADRGRRGRQQGSR
jgi:hypothetical protein